MKIKLSGKTELSMVVDDNDYEKLSQHKWYLRKDGYIARTADKRTVYAHRVIMNTPDGMHTDHINRDKLDNRKANLRICTHKENMVNRKYNDKSRGYAHKFTVRGYEYWVGIVKVNKVIYRTTTCATKEMALGALKQMIKDKNI